MAGLLQAPAKPLDRGDGAEAKRVISELTEVYLIACPPQNLHTLTDSAEDPWKSEKVQDRTLAVGHGNPKSLVRPDFFNPQAEASGKYRTVPGPTSWDAA